MKKKDKFLMLNNGIELLDNMKYGNLDLRG